VISHQREQTSGFRFRGLLAALVAVVLTSCHGPGGVFRAGPAVGPMERGEGWGTYCSPKHGESDFVLGVESLDDTGDHHLVLDSATVAGPSNVSESAAYVSLIKSHQRVSLFGVVPGMPPQFYARDQAYQWANKQPVPGTVVPTRASGDVLNLLVVVHAPDPHIRAAVHHLVVHYHAGRQQYVYSGNVTYVLAPGDDCPTPRRFRD
jgi:hypothetical protein